MFSYRHILGIALPAMAANMLLPLQGLVDTAIVGHFPNSNYLSALGLANSAFMLFYGSLNFLQYATSGLSSQALGAKNYERLTRILWRAFLIAFFLGLTLIATQYWLIAVSRWYFHATDTVGVPMAAYMRIRFFGSVFELGIYATLGWFAGQGLSRYMFYQQLLLTAGNIVLSLLLVYGAGMGIAGVAWGTVIANALAFTAAVLLVVQYQKKQGTYFFSPNWQRVFQWLELRELLLLNRDLFIRTLMLALCLSWFQRLGKQLGVEISAANIVLLYLVSLFSLALDGVAIAAESLTGQSIGAKNGLQLHKVIQRCAIVGLLTAVGMSVLFSLFFPLFLSLMTNIDSVYQIAWNYRWFVLLLPIIVVGSFVLGGIYFGATASVAIRNSALIVTGIVFPLGFLMVQLYGNIGLWLTIYVFYLLRFGLLGAGLKKLLGQAFA